MAHVSVVIPVYKGEECLGELYRRLREALETITRDFEIIMVEDCGPDRSWEVITELSAADPRVKGLQFSRNFGQHYGITAGIDHSDGDWVIVMDCDLQDRPEEIPRLYAKAREGHDVVLARRMRRKHRPLKRLQSWFFYKVFRWLSGMNYDGQVGNFRIVSRKVIDNFRQMREQLRFFGGLMEWMGFPAASIEVQHGERYRGDTTYTFRKLMKLAMETIIAYSDKPLRLSIRLGFLMSASSILFGSYLLVRALLYGSPVMGWSSMIVSIFFIGGIIIAILGIIGTYLGKIFDETRKRPLYVVHRRVGL